MKTKDEMVITGEVFILGLTEAEQELIYDLLQKHQIDYGPTDPEVEEFDLKGRMINLICQRICEGSVSKSVTAKNLFINVYKLTGHKCRDDDQVYVNRHCIHSELVSINEVCTPGSNNISNLVDLLFAVATKYGVNVDTSPKAWSETYRAMASNFIERRYYSPFVGTYNYDSVTVMRLSLIHI